MPGTKPPKQPRPRPEQIRDLIHRLAVDTRNIVWGGHAHRRMVRRDITDRMAVEVMRTGLPRGPIDPGINPGEWEVKMVKEIKGRREVGVVVITIANQRLFVKTVEWEDPK